MGHSFPEECRAPGEAGNCAIIVFLSRRTILGEAHSLNFIIHRLWFLLLKESLQKIFGNLRCVVVHTSRQEKSGFESCLELSVFARSCVSPLFSACLIN